MRSPEVSLGGYGLIKNFESPCFLLERAASLDGWLQFRFRRTESRVLASPPTKKSEATLTFLNFPWSSYKHIEICAAGIGAGRLVVRICRDGAGPWEFKDLHLAGSGIHSFPTPFSSIHAGYRLEILDTAGLITGQQIILSIRGLGEKSVLSPEAGGQWPKLLLIDSTLVGSDTATGQIKQVFLEQWPETHLLQIYETSGKLRLKRWRTDTTPDELTDEQLLAACREFGPDVIYFRPVDSGLLLEFTERAANYLSLPLVIHMMDDWPERLRAANLTLFSKLDPILRRLLKQAVKRLSISQAMSDAYAHRYGYEFTPLANGVDVEKWPSRDWMARPAVSKEKPFLIRYMGALAHDMTFASVVDVAKTVAALQGRLHVRFEISTVHWCLEAARKAVGELPGITVQPLVERKEYSRRLAEADALLIAYNFDSESIRYVGLSMANKLPECLASGAVLLAYGPPEMATIDYLAQSKCAHVVLQKSHEILCREIEFLVTHIDYCAKMGREGRQFASTRHSKRATQQTFLRIHQEAAGPRMISNRLLLGPYQRLEAHYDETNCIAHLFSGPLNGRTMIDVGAHQGSALQPFLNLGWKVFAFEPDNKNRQKLLENLKKYRNAELVKLDSRAVSNESRSGATFFRSDESTGISGLSAFHSSHKSEQTVDTVTLKEALSEETIASIDFLKIDTEGYDLFVLKGFPWDRFRPAVIECEFEDSKTVPLGYSFHDLAKFLVERQYHVYVSEWHPVVRYGIRHDWKCLMRYPCELSDPKAWGNLLAFREPIDETVLVAAAKKVMKFAAPQPTLTAPAPAVPAAVASHAKAEQGLSRADAPRTPVLPHSSSGTLSKPEPTGAPGAAMPVKAKLRLPEIQKRSKTMVVLGNGPSLRGFDFNRVKGFDAIGMNAAYRYWDRIGWYPRYYICLDLVVGLHHKDQIARLIRDRELNGMECFMLRRNLIEALPRELASLPCVLDYDTLHGVSDLFPQTRFTTGSQSPLFGSLLGYRHMVLMGVDCNYIQTIEGVVSRGGTVLELTKTPSKNPNYFFDDYQIAGDRFNVPDTVPDLHLNSWRAIAPVLAARGVTVWNGSDKSRLDVFPRKSFEDIEWEERPARQGCLTISMDKAPAGANWQSPEVLDGIRFCRTGAGERTTLKARIGRDRRNIGVIAFHASISQDHLAGLHLEIDGASTSHEVRMDLNPPCIVAVIPPGSKPSQTPTALELVTPGPRGLPVLSVSILPEEPFLGARFPVLRYPRQRMARAMRRDGARWDFPLSHFDGRAYLRANKDVENALAAGHVASALVHYYKRGLAERRSFTVAIQGEPNAGALADVFDGCAYLQANPDVAAALRKGAISSALDHFVHHGREEGRQAFIRHDGGALPATAIELMRQDAIDQAKLEVSALRREAQNAREAVTRGLRQEGVEHARKGEERDKAREAQIGGLKAEIARLEKLAGEQTAKLRQEGVEHARKGEERDKAREAQIGGLKAEIARLEKLAGEQAEKLRQEGATIEARIGALNADVAQARSDLARAAPIGDLTDFRRKTEAELERLRENVSAIGDFTAERTESLLAQLRRELTAILADQEARGQGMSARLEAVQSALADVQATVASGARTEDLAILRQQTEDVLGKLSNEVAALSSARAELENGFNLQLDALKADFARAREGAARSADLDRLERDTGREFERARSEMATRLTVREAREQALAEQIELLRIAADEAQRRLSTAVRAEDVDRVKHDAQHGFELIKSEIASSSTAWNAREQALRAQIDTLKAEIETAKSRADLAEAKVGFVGEGAREIAGSVTELQSKLAAETAEVARLQAALNQVREQAAATSARVSHASLDAFNVVGYQAHPRALSKPVAERLSSHWGPLLGLSIQQKELYYLAHRVASLESACIGRLAASVQDILLRILVARSVKGERLELLEIGTLFGLGVGVMHEALAPLFDRVHFTVIDPLDGYYGKNHRDVLTGVPVSRATFDENLRRMGVGKSNVTVIERLSTDSIAARQARKTACDCLIIDGDHSYDGVRHDSETYIGTVKPGGYVLFDDYNNEHWPAVRQYVDSEIMPRADLKFIGSEWHTAVFRVAERLSRTGQTRRVQG